MSIRTARSLAIFAAALIGAAHSASPALAQQQAPGLPTTVQLPTFSYFSVQTAVSVPDSGGAYSEAARQARLRPSPGLQPAGAQLGANAQRAAGQGRGVALSGAGASLSATVHHSPDEMLPHGTAPVLGNQQFAQRLAQQADSSAARPAMSIHQARAAWQNQQQAHEQAALELVQRGDQALARGNRAAAKIYYQNAARRSEQSARQQAQTRLQQLGETLAR